MRYLRQTLVPEIGKSGQVLLQNAKVLCVGLGGLGSPATLYLAGAGIGTLGLIDNDEVSLSNLHRQVLFSSAEVGLLKVDSAKIRLYALNPEIEIKTYAEELTAANASEIISVYDLVIDGTDRFATKFLINDTCYKLNKPWIYASVSQWEGQSATFHPNKDSPCYRCLQPAMPKVEIQNCAESGVVGPVVGMMGTHQALQAIQFLLKPTQVEKKFLHVFNGLEQNWLKLKILKNSNCTTCSKAASEIVIQDEEDLACALTSAKHITAKEFLKNRETLAKRHIILDVRELDEWNEFHLDEAIHWPLKKIQNNELPNQFSEKNILICCQSGIRSKKAAALLKAAGFLSITELKDGINALADKAHAP
jgi:molybdopterin/thiamine biosynthesis adenylyltransferase/rhodanese-related sulfurtransferase